MPEPSRGPSRGPSPAEVARLATEEMLEHDAATRTLGMTVRDCGPGTARVTMAVRPDMLNGWGACHGGVIASLADTAFAVACNSHGTVTVAAGFEVTFLEPVRLDDELVAVATETARRGRNGVYDVVVQRARDDVVVATFRGRSRATAQRNPRVP